MNSSYDKIKSLSKDEILDLLHEIKHINNSDKPRYATKSKMMIDLLGSEKTNYNHWSDQFSNVRRYIELSIIDRVLKGELK